MVLVVKNLPANAGDLRDMSSIPRLGRSPRGEHDNLLQVCLPEEFHGQESLAGYSPWGRRKSDMTGATEHACTHAVVRYKTERSGEPVTQFPSMVRFTRL